MILWKHVRSFVGFLVEMLLNAIQPEIFDLTDIFAAAQDHSLSRDNQLKPI
jgi:hypothetical protein